MSASQLKLTIAAGEPSVPTVPDLDDAEVQIWRDHGGSICAYGYTRDDQHWMHVPGVASFSFSHHAVEVTAIPHPPLRAQLIRDTYHRSVLPMALQALDLEVLHASAVRTPHGVVALCGFSATGKSTIAFGLGRRGYPVWADDAVAFEASGPCLRAIPLPFEVRLRPDPASFFARDQTAASATSAWDHVDQVREKPTPLAAVWALTQDPSLDEPVVVERLRPSTALPPVLAQAYCFSLREPARKQRMVKRYLDLIARVPVFEIRFQPGLERLPLVLDAIEGTTDFAR